MSQASDHDNRQINFRVSAVDHEALRIFLVKLKTNYRDYFMGLHRASSQATEFSHLDNRAFPKAGDTVTLCVKGKILDLKRP